MADPLHLGECVDLAQCPSIVQSTETIEEAIKEKTDRVEQLDDQVFQLCDLTTQTNCALYQQKERFTHYTQEYEEAWGAYEAALQLCEGQGVSAADIIEVISSVLSETTSQTPSPPSQSTPSHFSSPNTSSSFSFSTNPPPTQTASPSCKPKDFSSSSPTLPSDPQKRPPVPPRPARLTPSPSFSSLTPILSTAPLSPASSPSSSPPSSSPPSSSPPSFSPSPDSPTPSLPSASPAPSLTFTNRASTPILHSSPSRAPLPPSTSTPTSSPSTSPLHRTNSKKKKKEKGLKGGERAGGILTHEPFETEWEGEMRHACALFNQKPKLCFEFLRENFYIPPHKITNAEGEEEVMEKEGWEEELKALYSSSLGLFLLGFGDQLDQELLGEYLSDRSDTVDNIDNIREDYFRFIGLRDIEVSAGLRKILSYFRLPGESQKIERLLESFAEIYFHQQTTRGVLKNSDTVLVLAYSLTMLNTDAHNPQVKRKMKKEEFVKNNRGINDGGDLPLEFLESLYDDIVNNEIKTQCNQIFPRAVKRGPVSLKPNSSARYSRRWMILNEGVLHVFKSVTDTEPLFEIPLKGMLLSTDTKRKKIILQAKDILHASSGNFPMKLDLDNERDFQEWALLLAAKAGKSREFQPTPRPSPHSFSQRACRSWTDRGGRIGGLGKGGFAGSIGNLGVVSTEEVSQDLVSVNESDSSEQEKKQ